MLHTTLYTRLTLLFQSQAGARRLKVQEVTKDHIYQTSHNFIGSVSFSKWVLNYSNAYQTQNMQCFVNIRINVLLHFVEINAKRIIESISKPLFRFRNWATKLQLQN